MDRPGRPSLYKPEFAEQAFELCLAGATNRDLAATFEVGHSPIDNWLQNRPEFAQSVKRGRSLADGRVAHGLYSRAIGYTYETTRVVLHRGEPVAVPQTVHKPPDVRACFIWLSNRRPQQWGAGARPVRGERPDVRVLEEAPERTSVGAALGQAHDVRAADGELLHHAVVAPVEMIEAAEPRFAASAQSGDDKGGGRPDVRAGHGTTLQSIDTTNESGSAAHRDGRAHLAEFVDVPEALLEDGLRDGGGAGRHGQQRHDRSLQVRGKAGITATPHIAPAVPPPPPPAAT